MVNTPFNVTRSKNRQTKGDQLSHRVSSIIKDDMLLILSLMKRSGVNKILALIAKKPGLSVKELSAELKMRKKTTSDHIRELLAKGVIVKNNKIKPPGYVINDENNQHIIRAIDFTLDEK